VQKKRDAMTAAFQKSKIYKQYEATALKAQNDYQSATLAFENSAVYKEYEKKSREYQNALTKITGSEKYKWYQYNLTSNPSFGFHGTSLEPFNMGQQVNGYIE